MTLDTLTALFGWMTVINVILLTISTLMLTLFRQTVLYIHSKVTGLEAGTLMPAYLYFLAFYKVLIVIFNLVPYLALKLI